MSSVQSHNLIHRLLENQALKNPEAVAITFQDQQLTYQELNQKSNQVAHYLVTLGVKPETFVGVCVERSLEMMIILLGVLKAGGAYVPLDPSYPSDRIAFMIEDSALPILITEQAQLANLPQHSAHVVVMESDWEEIERHSLEQVISSVTTDNLAYTIYTSGSTGKPKGVQVMHRSAVNLYKSMSQSPGLTAQDTLVAISSICFDMSVLELFLPLSVGARIALLSREVAADGVRLAQEMTAAGVTMMQATPATWRLLLATGWQGNSQLKILCGGEAMSVSLAEQLLSRCDSLWNMYGPTETTVWSTLYQIKSSNDAVFVGHPIANTQIYLIDQKCRRKGDVLKQIVVGQSGEIYIGGDGLARGYLNRLEMTEDRFVPDPFSNIPSARLYKTGDLARMLPDGNMQFIGRADNQVKIRGYRVELGDIEAAINKHPEVKEAVVITREDNMGEKRLVAYVIFSNSLDLLSALRVYLKEQLPEYMVPASFVVMDSFPLTPNGKVDRRALPAPSSDRPDLDEEFVPPSNPIEEQLAKIWSQGLEISLIGINDNFFDLGGHSLLVAQMMTQVSETFQVVLPLSCLFKSPTIAGLARSILGAQQPQKDTNIVDESDLLADTILSPSITPDKIGVDWSQAPQNILLTGATGFLGAFLLDELLQSTKATIYCLVRSSSLAVAQQKLQRNLERYGLDAAAQSDRVVPLLGDLSQPLLGLSEVQFHKLAGQIDLIYHNGAFVNLVYPYAALRDINVKGTEEILRLAAQVQVKPVHFISTLDVFQSSYHAQLDKLLESDEFPAQSIPGSGYAQSKWVAEKLVKAAHERGIPTCIHRPGMIIGHSQTGFSNTEDSIGRLIKGLIQLGSAPTLSLPMHLTPVDYVSKAIVKLSEQQSSWGQAFHFSNPRPLSLDQLVDYIRSLHYEIKYTDHDNWLTQLLNVDAHQENALKPMLPLLTSPGVSYSKYLEVLNLDNVSCQNVMAGLAETEICCPEVNSKLLENYFTYFVQSGFLERQSLPEQQLLVAV
jgi:amino acid adenylation domain-containing protein/thioester reductase-like protein